MSNIIIIIALVMIAAIIYLNFGGFGGSKDSRMAYLEKMSKFLEAPLNKIEGEQNSYSIHFVYKGHELIYEDIEEEAFKRSTFRGALKAKVPFDLNLAFTERARSSMRDSMSSIQDATSPWLQNVGKVLAPIELKEFSVHTNNQGVATALLADEQVVRILAKFKNVDSRGHPVMSMEFMNGMLLLRFHPPGGLAPSLANLQHNVTTIEEYLNKFIVVLDKLHKIKLESK